MTIGWGIISTGRHPDIKVVPAMKQVKGAKVNAAYSRDIKRAEAFAEKHDIPKAFDSMDKLLRDPEVDAVFISSPNHLHARHAIEAAKSGKHVLVEKPMATTWDDAWPLHGTTPWRWCAYAMKTVLSWALVFICVIIPDTGKHAT